MHYQEVYGANNVFDSLRNQRINNELINIDWIKCQVYGSTFYIPEMFPSEIPELISILVKITRCLQLH